VLPRTITRNSEGYADGGRAGQARRAERRPRAELWWRDWAAPPDLGLTLIKTKVATGVRTSTLGQTPGVAKPSWRPALQTLFLAYLADNFVLDDLRKRPEMDIEHQCLQDGLD
jgi:hypothetical protein